jgi:hypothetical protein
MTPYPVSLTREMQRDAELLEAIADWRNSHGVARVRERRYAMLLVAAERGRRNVRRWMLAAAVNRNQRRRIAA